MSFLTNLSYSGRTLSKTVDGTTSTVFTCENEISNRNNPITSGATEEVLSNINDTLLLALTGESSGS